MAKSNPFSSKFATNSSSRNRMANLAASRAN